MKGRVFIDSNIFLYILDSANLQKQNQANEFLKKIASSNKISISTQVLNEVYAVSTRKLNIEPLLAKDFLRLLNNFDVILINVEIINSAIDCSILNRISYWDALMVAAAESARCKCLYTEDLKDKGKLRGVTIVNPFIQ
jgi:predicted nucleic acid-binding protein